MVQPTHAWAAAVGLLLLLLPASAGHHCETGLAVHPRSSLAPAPMPHVSNSPGYCVATSPLDSHEFPPITDQVFVRVNGAMSPAIKSVLIQLDGLGWDRAFVRANRTIDATGEASYDLAQWLTIPGGAATTGTLRVTMHHPGGYSLFVEYHKSNGADIPAPPITLRS